MAFKKHTTDSFFGDFLYERIVPQDHFLRKAKELIDWSSFSVKLIKYYKGEGLVGRAPYNPSVILRMLFLCYLYNISERQIEERVNMDMAFKYFAGLGADEKAPDHSTLTYFKERLIQKEGIKAYNKIFDELLNQASNLGIEFGQIQIVDAVHTGANINIDRDNGRKRKGKESVDKDAKWGVKHSRKVKDTDGKEYIQKHCFLGYKSHVSLNESTGLVTGFVTTSGNEYDGNYLSDLVEADLLKNLPKKFKKRPTIYAADRGYDDGENHIFLKNRKLQDAIKLNNYRTEKKDPNKEIWVKLKKRGSYQKGLKVRYKIERKFGEAKKHHGFSRCRYLSLQKYHIQATLTFMSLNLKEIIKMTTDVRLKSNPVKT